MNSTDCTHDDVANCLYKSGGSLRCFTVARCPDCGLMDVRSGSDELNNGENAWSQTQEVDDLLCRYVQPRDREPGYTMWLITKEQFDALPNDVQAFLLPSEEALAILHAAECATVN
jgi:hypothetical protein